MFPKGLMNAERVPYPHCPLFMKYPLVPQPCSHPPTPLFVLMQLTAVSTGSSPQGPVEVIPSPLVVPHRHLWSTSALSGQSSRHATIRSPNHQPSLISTFYSHPQALGYQGRRRHDPHPQEFHSPGEETRLTGIHSIHIYKDLPCASSGMETNKIFLLKERRSSPAGGTDREHVSKMYN